MDTDDLLALYQPEGTLIRRWHILEQRYLEGATTSKGETLRLLFPGRAYDVTLFFEAAGEVPWFYDALFGEGGLQAGWRENRRLNDGPESGAGTVAAGQRFRGWYVNMQSPFRRTPFGVDIVDHTLDIVVRPDRAWYWKDEDELKLAVERGACTETYAAEIRSTGEQVVQLIEAAHPPFDATWTAWRPASTEPILDIPDGWQYLPALISEP